MGLDMYLIKKYYIGAQSEYNNITGTVEIYQQGVKIPIEINDIKYIESEAVYWRKANMIHKWFVDHAQEGTDDCKRYYVSREQLKELLDTCKQVIENHERAGELLPTQDGFFFGSSEYDNEYFKYVEYTVEQLSKLDLSQNTGFCYYYESSW